MCVCFYMNATDCVQKGEQREGEKEGRERIAAASL